ncbi:MAG: hypothetical protein ABIH21_01075 [Patescibacteria group bacterium]
MEGQLRVHIDLSKMGDDGRVSYEHNDPEEEGFEIRDTTLAELENELRWMWKDRRDGMWAEIKGSSGFLSMFTDMSVKFSRGHKYPIYIEMDFSFAWDSSANHPIITLMPQFDNHHEIVAFMSAVLFWQEPEDCSRRTGVYKLEIDENNSAIAVVEWDGTNARYRMQCYSDNLLLLSRLVFGIRAGKIEPVMDWSVQQIQTDSGSMSMPLPPEGSGRPELPPDLVIPRGPAGDL